MCRTVHTTELVGQLKARMVPLRMEAMRLVGAAPIDDALRQALLVVVPKDVSLLTDAECTARESHRPWPLDRPPTGGFWIQVGDSGFAGISVNRIHPFVDGRPLDLDGDLSDFERGLLQLLDEVADEITEGLRTPWPDSTFPRPGVRVVGDDLMLWYGQDLDPILRLPSISLASVALTAYRDLGLGKDSTLSERRSANDEIARIALEHRAQEANWRRALRSAAAPRSDVMSFEFDCRACSTCGREMIISRTPTGRVRLECRYCRIVTEEPDPQNGYHDGQSTPPCY